MLKELNFEYDESLNEEVETIKEFIDENDTSSQNLKPNKIKRRKVPKNYINNADFYEALVNYRNIHDQCLHEGKNIPSIPNYIGECWIKIAEGLARKPCFFQYSFKQEMINDAILNCNLYWKNFNPEKSKNPFAYFTQFSYFAFLRRIEDEKLEQYVKYKSSESFLSLDEAEFSELSEGQFVQEDVYVNIKDFIKKFEDSKTKKKNSVVKKEKKATGVECFYV